MIVPVSAQTEPAALVEHGHGRATELAALVTTLPTFYETGVAENPCNGPCNQDDLSN